MAKGMDQQRLATETGYWPLFTMTRSRKQANPFQLDSKAPKGAFRD